MPSLIKLDAIPKQSFNITLGNYSYDLKLFSNDGSMAYDLYIDGVNVIQGFKFVNEVLMLPYEHQELNGNLLLVVPEDELPDYESFGSTQFLIYLDADETEVYRDSFDY